MHTLTVSEILRGLQDRSFSAVELTQHFLNRIRELDSHYNAFITVTEETALAAAADADRQHSKAQPDAAKPSAGRPGLVHSLLGLPIAHKDIFCTDGVKTSCGSRMLDNFVAPYDATVVTRLAEAGAISLGKCNMDEFAMGSSNETSHYGAVRNPWDVSRVPGGSSGGSAAAVCAGLCPAATGTDTGGSIRQPAALCGVTGMKPTYGRVSRWGMIAYASSLDQAGTLTRSAEDAALLLSAMAGHDPRDSTSVAAPAPDYVGQLSDPIEGKRIGICREYFDEGLDRRVEACTLEAAKVLESLGAQLVDIELPTLVHSIPAYYVIAPAECSANLSRYDGVRFGHRCDAPKDLEDLYRRSRSEGFGREVKRRIMMGAFALSAGYYDAYYLKAQQIRRLIKDDFERAFQDVDVLLGPTSPTTAFGLGEKSDDQIAMYLQDIYTIAANLAGLPAISVPAGFVDGLPTGLQLIGNHLGEAELLNVAHRYQTATDWHRMTPPTPNGGEDVSS